MGGEGAADAREYVGVQDFTADEASAVAGPVWAEECGRNTELHRNSDNVVTAPGQAGGAEHEHDYVGNLSTDAFSTDRSLAAAATTCGPDNRSAYSWPVLRLVEDVGDVEGVVTDAEGVLLPDSVSVTYSGNPTMSVVAMPRFLRAETGNARAVSRGGGRTELVSWSCSDTPGRSTDRYPVCPPGESIVRTFTFPSCWDGRRVDSPDHRAHLRFTAADGSCPPATFAIPRLRIELRYPALPAGSFVIDTAPDEDFAPVTDHAHHVNVVSDAHMREIVRCLEGEAPCAEPLR
jgi:hypothetical protein